MNEQAPLLRDKVLDGVVRQEVTFPGRPMILARLSPSFVKGTFLYSPL